MLDAATYALPSVAVATALVHTLIPDHWLPFVLIGRARGWSAGTVGLVSGLAALIHAVLSVALGLAAWALGRGAAEATGETLEGVAAVLLVAFGAGYAVWAWAKRGHFHPAAGLVHHGGDRPCAGDEGPANPEHLHYHADQELIGAQRGWSALGLAVIVGANPCVVMLPVLLGAAARGGSSFAFVALAYVIPTVALMVVLPVLGVRAARRIRLPGAARHMEWASGVAIALLGLLYWL